MDWISVSNYLPKDKEEERGKTRERILIYSPVYDENDPMLYRIIDSQFLDIKILLEVTHWAYLEPPKTGRRTNDD